MRASPRIRPGFTLIELLIVVAIIAILAAIAVPNFLEAQTRAKISRTLSDMRTIRTGLETYYVDNNKYPETDGGTTDVNVGLAGRKISLYRLTTPISFLTSIPSSPFKEKYGTATTTNPKIASTYNGYLYVNKYATLTGSVAPKTIDTNYRDDRGAYIIQGALMPVAQQDDIKNGGGWLMKSVGPDNLDDRDSVANGGFGTGARLYDATNGTVSRGDIVTFSDRPGTGKL